MVTAAEDPAVTTGYTDYFVADGMQTTLTIHCVGAAAIQKCKEGFLVNDRSIVVSFPSPCLLRFPCSSSLSHRASQSLTCLPIALPGQDLRRDQQRDGHGL